MVSRKGQDDIAVVRAESNAEAGSTWAGIRLGFYLGCHLRDRPSGPDAVPSFDRQRFVLALPKVKRKAMARPLGAHGVLQCMAISADSFTHH